MTEPTYTEVQNHHEELIGSYLSKYLLRRKYNEWSGSMQVPYL